MSNNTPPLMRSLIINKVKLTGCITARNLILHLFSCNTEWTKAECTKAIMECSSNNDICEAELIYPDNQGNESIFFPSGTVLRSFVHDRH